MRSIRRLACALVTLTWSPLAHATTRWGQMPVHGWFQAEAGQDALREQVGMTVPMTPDAAAAFALVASNTAVEAQLGVAMEFGFLDLFPLVGVEHAFRSGSIGLTPQLHAVVEPPPIPLYIEGWIRFGVNTPFGAFGQDDWISRYFLLVAIKRWVAVGAQVEAGGPLGGPLTTLPVGARANFRANERLSVGVFAGWETRPAGRLTGLFPTPGVVGRATVDVTW